MQLREAAQELYRGSSPAACPLFQELAPRIADSLSRAGIVLPDEEDMETELWRMLGQRVWCSAEHERCNLNRFQSSISAAMKNVDLWWVHFFERCFLALEMDFLRGKQCVDRLVKLRLDSGAAGNAAPGAAPTAAVTVDDKMLRGCQVNAVVISVFMLQEESNRRLVTGVVECGKAVRAWHVEQNRLLRSAEGAEEWVRSQVRPREGYLAHVIEIVQALSTPLRLERCGFTITGLRRWNISISIAPRGPRGGATGCSPATLGMDMVWAS